MWQLRLNFSYRKNETRYYPDTIDLHWCWCSCWFVCRTTDFFLYELAGSLINWGTEQQPFLMGIVVSVLMGMILTLPISSAALGVILNLSGLAAGAATVGCCCNMIGFAVASYRENKIGGFLAQELVLLCFSH